MLHFTPRCSVRRLMLLADSLHRPVDSLHPPLRQQPASWHHNFYRRARVCQFHCSCRARRQQASSILPASLRNRLPRAPCSGHIIPWLPRAGHQTPFVVLQYRRSKETAKAAAPYCPRCLPVIAWQILGWKSGHRP